MNCSGAGSDAVAATMTVYSSAPVWRSRSTTDANAGDAAGALDHVALADGLVLAEERDADVVLLEVEHHAADVMGELHQLARHRAREAIDARDAVAGGEHGAGLLHRHLLVVL